MKPIIKYPGGKEKELKYIKNNLPNTISNYYEPFVGGGAVYFDINAQKYFINDKSEELMLFYRMVKSQNTDFILLLNSFNSTWKKITTFCENNKEELVHIYVDGKEMALELISKFIKSNKNAIRNLYFKEYKNGFKIEDTIYKYLCGKYNNIKRIQTINKKLSSENDIFDNIVCAFKASYYVYLRHVYSNSSKYKLKIFDKAALYFFMREYCYSSMFRFNSDGEFNVPYGGISYNEKYLTNKIGLIQSKEYVDKFRKTTNDTKDFYDFMKKYPPKDSDFIFLDPPYDTDFSTYDKNEFGKEDQKRLANYLINECKGNFMLIIKKTPFISSLYKNKTECYNKRKLKVTSFSKTYTVSFKNRNDRDCTHLMICNY